MRYCNCYSIVCAILFVKSVMLKAYIRKTISVSKYVKNI